MKYTVRQCAPKMIFTNLGEVSVVEFELENGVITPSELKEAICQAPVIPLGSGVVLLGRGGVSSVGEVCFPPVWLFAALVHHYSRRASFVGCYDPRLGGVVVGSHHDGVVVGGVIPV